MTIAIDPSTDHATIREAGALGALADERWSELDAGRRIPDDLYQRALRAELFRTLVPAEMGGVGGSPVDWFRIGVELARNDASFGWVVTQGAAELGWIAAGGDPSWASTVAGAGRLVVGGARPTFGGSWKFNTGCQGATWIGGLALVDGNTSSDGSPEVRFGWVPADRAQILDDWDATGLRGSGSHGTVIAEQAIEAEWTFSPFEPTANDRGAHRCVVGNGNWPIAGSVAATQLGIARRAIDEATQIARERAPAPEFVPLVESPTVQRALVRADGLWRACHASVERELEHMWVEAARDEALSTARRVSLFAAHATASEQARSIVESMCELAGTVVLDRDHPLSRCRRDSQALQGHLATNGAAVEHAGRVHLGLIPEHRRI
ncbi:MAG: acyl-CoA dehydrogenase family protein [Ilumatobacteraceae bacterium]